MQSFQPMRFARTAHIRNKKLKIVALSFETVPVLQRAQCVGRRSIIKLDHMHASNYLVSCVFCNGEVSYQIELKILSVDKAVSQETGHVQTMR